MIKKLIFVMFFAAFIVGCDNKEDSSKNNAGPQDDSKRTYAWPHKKTKNPDYMKY